MSAREYRTIDKTQWGPGPWQDEPDKIQWKDEATGLPCLIVRGPSGALCGYVGVDESHPLHGSHYGDLALEAHGGLTFSDRCAVDADEARHICHVPEPGEPDHVWWFGFDCAHSGDFCPAHQRYGSAFSPSPYEVYRDVGYVRAQVAALAEQLAMQARAKVGAA